MSNEDEGVSFGFAPDGQLSQQAAKRLARSDDVKKQAPSPALHENPMLSPKANLAWLLIGVLLGSGGTLMGSSLWLQDSYVSPSVAMDALPADASADVRANAPTNARTNANVDRPEKVLSEPATTDVGRLLKTAEDTDVLPVDPTRQVAELRRNEREARAGLNESERALLVKHSSTNITGTLMPVKVETASRANEGEALLISSNETDGAADIVTGNLPATSAFSGADNQKVAEDGQVREPLLTGELRQLKRDGDIRIADRRVPSLTPETETGIGKMDSALKTTTTQRSSKRIYRVQLAAVDNETAAQAYWQEVQTRLPGLFNGVEPLFDRGKVNKRIFFRIWIGEFDKRGEADDYCSRIKSEGHDCFVTRG